MMMCPCNRGEVWRCSVCATYDAFRHRFGEGSIAFHFMKHAPLVASRAVLDRIQSDAGFRRFNSASLKSPFRAENTIQTDFLHHHIIMQTQPFDFAVSPGWGGEVHLILLDGSRPPAFESLTQDWLQRAPLFFTINDDGWEKCSVGRRLIWFFEKKFPQPSSFEQKNALDVIQLGHCTE